MSQTLYRFWNAADDLLYVGITVRPWERWKAHRGDKPWWEEVAKVTIENFETREHVAEAELEAIRSESPRYNIKGVISAADQEVEGEAESEWDGIHEPSPACIGDYLTCSCSSYDWEDPRYKWHPCGKSMQEHLVVVDGVQRPGRRDDCDDCERLWREWIDEQPFFRPHEYSAHVIAAVLGSAFAVRPHEPRRAKRQASVKFVADAWPKSMRHDLPAQWKKYAREWLDSGLSRSEVKEAVDIALDAWANGRTDRPWAYLSGITRRMIAEKEEEKSGDAA